MRTTPVEIEALLHVYYSPVPHPNRQSAAMQCAYFRFIRAEMIVPDGKGHFNCTDKGHAWVEMICHTPFPESQTVWVDPRTNQPVER